MTCCALQLKDEQAAPAPAPAFAAPVPAASAAEAQQIKDLQEQLRSEETKHKEAKQALLHEQQYFASEIAHLETLIKGTRPIT